MNRVAKKELKELNRKLRKQEGISIKETENGFLASGSIILDRMQIIQDKKFILMLAGGKK